MMKQESKSLKASGIPLLCWDLASVNLYDTFDKSKDLLTMSSFKRKYKWNSDVAQLLDMEYEALILTDPSQVIMWVNDGFSAMTGYEGKFAIGKTPRFLQGPETNQEVKKRIHERLSREYQEPFTEHLKNYRRTKELYNCEVTIVPLYDANNVLVNYLALEKEVA